MIIARELRFVKLFLFEFPKKKIKNEQVGGMVRHAADGYGSAAGNGGKA